MKIKTRLITSYIAMMILPVLLFFLILPLFETILSNIISEETFQGRLMINVNLEDNNESFYNNIIDKLANNPPLSKDRQYFEDINLYLKNAPNPAGIIVEKNRSFLYVSNELKSISKLVQNLPIKDGQSDSIEHQGKVFTLKRYRFSFWDRSPGFIYFLADVSPAVNIVSTLFLVIASIFIILVAITNGILTFFISRSIIKPLQILKEGAENIKNGDLNFQLSITSKDEFGELNQTFEEMRSRLKNSLDTQLQFENNRKEMISAISHDLKTPVTSIKGYVEGILDGVADSPEKLQKYLLTIHANANRLDQLIEEFFLFSKLDLRKLPFIFEPIVLTSFINDFIEEIRLTPKYSSVEIEVSYDCLNPSTAIIADREKIHRVLTNIFSNSLKYMDPEKNVKFIKVNVKEDSEYLVIQITDNGKGIKNDELPMIFERFYRAERDRNSKTGGSGLGLAIAKLIIEEHQGRIWVESTYGEGTIVNFTLHKSQDSL